MVGIPGLPFRYPEPFLRARSPSTSKHQNLGYLIKNGFYGLIAAAILLPSAAATESLSYNNIEGGLRHQLNNELEVGGSARIITGDLDYVGFTGTARYAIKRDFKLFAELDVYDSELGIIGGVSLDF